jgi:hypothetical protein
MLRSTFCALQVDAGRRPRWITPCKPQAQLGDMDNPPISELRSSSTLYEVAAGVAPSLPRAAPAACTGLSKSDAFRRQFEVHKKYYVTSRIKN